MKKRFVFIYDLKNPSTVFTPSLEIIEELSKIFDLTLVRLYKNSRKLIGFYKDFEGMEYFLYAENKPTILRLKYEEMELETKIPLFQVELEIYDKNAFITFPLAILIKCLENDLISYSKNLVKNLIEYRLKKPNYIT